MSQMPREVDYLVVGAGAMGMAFTDTILHESDATIALVDRLDRPGGHWNHAYPFVRLHQPSAYYGVNSRPLGENRLDASGRNAGMMELAGAHELLAYFDTVLRRDFLPCGRVSWYPQCTYLGDSSFRSAVTGETRHVKAGKVVDATYMNVQVPKVTPPGFEVAEGVTCVPPNGLATVRQAYRGFVVVGAGKTAIDSCLYLLDLGVAPDRITWIKPRESWLFDRAQMQPEGFSDHSILDYILLQAQEIAASTSRADLFQRLEACGALVRIEPDTEPTMFRCATVSQAELADLRRIRNVVRLGRVQRLETTRMVLDQGEVAYRADTLFIDCTADGLEKRPTKPIFRDGRITLQTVRPCQQLFAAAMIGHVECAYADEAQKNALCVPVPHPDVTDDYLHMMRDIMRAQMAWAADPGLFQWLVGSRLDGLTTPGFRALLEGSGPVPPEQIMDTVRRAIENLGRFMESR